jgi:hypothetical protein
MTEVAVTRDPGRVWRVGYRPDPWAWTDWRHATDEGRFNGRWDDQLADFRTLYTGESLLACLLEVLAHFRPDPAAETDLDEIEDPGGEIDKHPDAPSGTVGYRWLEERFGGSADLAGRYCFVSHSDTISALRARFPFKRFGLTPILLDASVLKDGGQRDVTRSIARWIFDLRDDLQNDLVDGIEFRSRFGDDLRVWAVFERVTDSELRTSARVENEAALDLHPDTPEVVEAFRLHGLRWND